MTATPWKLIRVSKDIHKELSALGQYGDSMGDILRKLLDAYYDGHGQKPPPINSKEQLKDDYNKFRRHARAAARLAKKNVNLSESADN